MHSCQLATAFPGLYPCTTNFIIVPVYIYIYNGCVIKLGLTVAMDLVYNVSNQSTTQLQYDIDSIATQNAIYHIKHSWGYVSR